jgi:glycosyltransferase involved in cell wall biosynthesis
VRYFREEKIGQCYARNRGLIESSGDIILFTDDDVRPSVNWIIGMCRPIKNCDAHAAVGGIRIAPQLQRRWLLEGFPAFAACLDVKNIGDAVFLVGANMAFSRCVLKQVSSFDVHLGPGALGFGDESLFGMQLREAGYKIAVVHDVEVEHHFDEIRLRPQAVIETARKMGRSRAYMAYHWEHSDLAGFDWFACCRKTVAYAWKRLTNFRIWDCPDVPPYWRLPAIEGYAFLVQLLRERRQPRLYARHGSKLLGTNDCIK